MKQRNFICKLANEGEKPKNIEELLQRRFGEEALKRSEVYRWAGLAKLGYDPNYEKEKPGPKPDEQLLKRIEEILDEEPFASLHYIAELLNENTTIIYRYLTQFLHKVYKSSRWLPHELTQQQKLKRVSELKSLHSILQSSKHESFRNIITGDQSWLTLYYSNNGAWLDSDDDPPEMIKNTIDTQKFMMTIIWGVHGFFIVDFLPQGESYDSPYFIANILQPLFEKKQEIWSSSNKKSIWLHLDNSHVHNSKLCHQKYIEFGFRRAPHPPYSPDVAPSDFYLFGFIKEKLKGRKFTSLDELKEAVLEILGTITQAKRKEVFQEWINRCEWIIQQSGAYYHK